MCRWFFASIALVIWPSVALGESVTLDMLLAAAISSSPAASELNLKESEALADALSVGLKHNPELSAEVRSRVGGTEGDTEYEIGLGQPIRPGDFGLRTQLREILEEAARSERGIGIIELSQKVKLLYAALWASHEQVRYFEETKEHALHISKTIERAISQGLLSTSEAQLFMAEAKRLEAEQIGARGERRKSEAELLRLTGLSGPISSPLKPNWPPLPPKSEIIKAGKESSLAERRVMLAANVSRLQSELARKGAWPAIVPRVAFEHTSEGEDRVNLGFSIDLPIFDRNQPERIKAKARERAAESHRRFFLDGRFDGEIDLRYESAADLTAQQAAYDSSVIPLLKSAFDALEKQYQAGQGSVLVIWQAQRELLETRQRSLELWLKAATARFELQALIGREL